MKYLLFAVVFASACAISEDRPVRDFGFNLQKVIKEDDRVAFSKLTCFPAACLDRNNVQYVFGTNTSAGFIKKFLENPHVQMKVFGPFRYDSSGRGSDYILIYYDPTLVRFNDKGLLSDSQREELWWKGYVETVVHCEKSVCGFNRTPFYHGAGLPWLEDY